MPDTSGKTEIPKIEIDFQTFENVYKAAKKAKIKKISFDFIVGSCFPEIAKNITQELRRQHAAGYMEGLQDAGVEYIHPTDEGMKYIKKEAED